MCTDTYRILSNTITRSPQGHDDAYRCVGDNYDKQHSYNNIFTGFCAALGIDPGQSRSVTVRSYNDEEQGRVNLKTPVKISKSDVESYVKENLQ